MTKNTDKAQLALGDHAARQLANATKTVPQLSTITPRWLTHLLQWIPVEAGIYRVNRVSNTDDIQVACTQRDEATLPQTFVDYDPQPREYFLNGVSTVLDIHTRVADLYSSPHDQIKEQLRLTIETIKERQESELINNPEYGLLASVSDEQRISTLNGPPTPDDLDDLLRKVWKEPGFFLAHPDAIAAFGRECTRRGVPPPTVSLFGSQFITWRGIPLIPSNKIPVEDGKTKILLLRVGEKRHFEGLLEQSDFSSPAIQNRMEETRKKRNLDASFARGSRRNNRLFFITTELEQLPIYFKSYIKENRIFLAEAKKYEDVLGKLNLAKNILHWVQDCKKCISYFEKKINDIQDNPEKLHVFFDDEKLDFANQLKEILDQESDTYIMDFDLLDQEQQEYFKDTETYFEDIYTKLKDLGYEVYHAWIDAK